jgi:cytochrome c biogenesis factor
MNNVGHQALIIGWLLSIGGSFGSAIGAFWGRSAAYHWARLAAFGAAVCAGSALASLAVSFLGDDFRLQYVWAYSNRELADLYKVSAIWAGMDGALLLWAFLLCLAAAALAASTHSFSFRRISAALLFLNATSTFFLSTVIFWVNPFRYLKAPFIPPDGSGLAPVLQHAVMVFRTPLLYLGLAFSAVPLAWALSDRLTGETYPANQAAQRWWAGLAWVFLSGGVLVTAYGTYIGQGQGDFWQGDLVESAILVVWLALAVFLHLGRVQERVVALRVFNFWLLVISFAAAIASHYLSCSGLVLSSHAFIESDFGRPFLLYLGLLAIVMAWPALRPGTPASGNPSILPANAVTRLGVHLSHVGFALMVLGVIGSTWLRSEAELSVARGKTAKIGRLSFQFLDLRGKKTPNFEALQTVIQVSRDAESAAILRPEFRTYYKSQENILEPDARSSWSEDLYLVLGGVNGPEQAASFRLLILPLQAWLWIGGALLVIGGIMPLCGSYGARE